MKRLMFVLLLLVFYTGCKSTARSQLDVRAHAVTIPVYPGCPGCDVHVTYHLETASR